MIPQRLHCGYASVGVVNNGISEPNVEYVKTNLDYSKAILLIP